MLQNIEKQMRLFAKQILTSQEAKCSERYWCISLIAIEI